MNVPEYLSARRAYALVRQTLPASGRVTFEELAILCHLANAEGPLRTSQIAEYQGVLRPTMTHRTSHLARLGLIVRSNGRQDRRSVCCELSDDGSSRLEALLEDMCSQIKAPMPLSRCSARRMASIVDAMGSVSLSSSELVLLGLATSEAGALAVCELVELLGLLQPTVSMAVSSLVGQGLVRRGATPDAPRQNRVVLEEAGAVRAARLGEAVEALRVHNARRGHRAE